MFNVKPTIEATSGKPPGKQISESVNNASLKNYQIISKLNGNVPLSGGFKQKNKKNKKNKKKFTLKKKIKNNKKKSNNKY